MREHHSADGPNPQDPGTPEGRGDRPDPRAPKRRRKQGAESLEDRILLSGTWADVDTGDMIEGATDGADAFDGSAADEIVNGLGGNDDLFGGGGDDTISGDAGDDTIDGGAGDDTLDGGEGDDTLASGGGGDAMSGGAGDDTFVIEGAQDGDVLTVDGGSGTDRIDLSAYDGEMTFRDGSVEVELDGGGSFRVEYSEVDTIAVGDLTINDSTVSADATIQADSLTITSASRIDADISVSGDIVTTDTSVGGSGVITLDGEGDQTVSASGGTGEINNLSIDKASGSVTISDSLQISGSYDDNAYAVDASGSTLQFEGYATISGSGTEFGDVTLNGGTFTVEGSMDVGGDLHISSAYGVNAGIINVSGDVLTTDTGVGGTGVIALSGDGDQTIHANGGTGELNNLAINKLSGSVTISDSIQISNSYDDNGFAVDASAASVQFEGYATIDAAGTDFGDVTFSGGTFTIEGEMAVGGDLHIDSAYGFNSGTISVAGDVITTDTGVGGTGVISLAGDGDQTIHANGGAGEISNLSIDKSSGSVTVSDSIQISSSYNDHGYDVDASGAEFRFEGYSTIDAAGTDFGDVTFYGGTFTIEGEMAVGGDLHIDSAYGFNSGTIAVSGDVITTDTGVGGNGVISLAGDGDQAIHANGGAGEISNLSIDKSSGSVTVSDSIQISGSYNDNGYAVDASGADFRFEGYSTVDAAGTDFGDVTFYGGTFTIEGEMAVGGDLHIDSAYGFNSGTIAVSGDVITTDTGVGGNGVISLAGDGDQTIHANGGAGEISNLSIDKPSGSVIVSDSIQISGSYNDNGYAVDASGASVRFEGYSEIDAAGTEFGDVTLYGGTFTLESDVWVSGDLRVQSAYNVNGAGFHVAGEIELDDTHFGGTSSLNQQGEAHDLGDEGSTFVVDEPTSGETMIVRGGAGVDTLDLSSFSSSDATFRNGMVEVNTDDGMSFAVAYSDIETISFADLDAEVLNRDLGGRIDGAPAILIRGGDAATIGFEGAGSADWSYDHGTGELTIVNVSETGAESTLAIDALGGTAIPVGSISIESDIGAITSDADIGTLTIDHEATVGAVTVENGSIGTVSFEGGNAWSGPVEFNADIGTLQAQEFGTDITVNGDVGTISIVDDVTNDSTLRVTGDVGTLDIGDDIWKNADVSIGGSVGDVSIGGEIEPGSTLTIGGDADSVTLGGRAMGEVSVGGDLGTFDATQTTADLTVGGDAGTITIAGNGVDSDLRGDLSIGGDLGDLVVENDIDSTVTVGGNASSISAGDRFKGDGEIVVGGDAGTISAVDDISIDLRVGGDLTLYEAEHVEADITVGGDAGTIRTTGETSDSDFRGDITVGGDLTTLDAADDTQGAISVGGNAGTMTAGDDFKGSGPITIGGSLGAMTAGDRIAVDVSTGGDIGTITAPIMTGDLTVGDDLSAFNVDRMDGQISGSGGHNWINAGADGETITTGAGNDAVFGNGGDDTISLGEGNDTAYAGDATPVDGSPVSADTVDGGAGTDSVSYQHAGAGVDIDLDSGTAAGDSENDTLISIENAMGSEFDDTISGTDNANTLSGLGGDDVIDAGAGHDTLTGGEGSDVLDAGEGDDRIYAGDSGTDTVGSDTITGGDGTDTLDYAHAGSGVDVDMIDGTAAGATENDTFTGIENVNGSNYSDTIAGDDSDNTVYARSGDDTVNSGAGDDTVYAQSGDDTVDAGAGDDAVYGGSGDDTLDGGDGTDWARYDDVSGGVNVDLGAGTATGAAGNDTLSNFENVFGSSGGDTIQGDDGGNTIQGHHGDDTIRGGLGDDVLDGDGGTDTVSYSDIDGGGVKVNLGTGASTGAGGNDTLRDFENAEGSNQDDSITGNAGGNVLSGLDGDDTINAGAGNDTVLGGAGDDALSGEAGNDAIDGGEGNDTLDGGEGADRLAGGAGDDVIDGGAGDDTLIAGTGDDTLVGGAGTDTADYGAASASISVDLAGGTVASDAGDDTFSGVEAFRGTAFGDSFALGDATGGEHFTIDGGGGSNTLDLSQYSRTDVEMTRAGDSIVVSLPSGGSATIDFGNIQRVVLSDAEFDPRVPPHDAVPATGTLNEDGSFTTGVLLDTDALGNGRAFVENIEQPEHGTVIVNGNGTFTYRPDPDYSGTDSFTYTIDDVTGDTTATVTLSVTPDADTPIVVVENAGGVEDNAIPIDFSGALTDTDGSETLSFTVSGVPEGATLSRGTDNGNGSWTLAPDQLDGLTVSPPENFSGSFDLTVTATATDGTDTASASETLTVSVEAVVDTPTLSVGDVSGVEDTPIALGLESALTDTDGSETLSVTVSGVPSGAALSAGVDNGDGSWTLSGGQLDGLSITPPTNFSGEFELAVTATSTESNGDAASVESAFSVSVTGAADDAELTAGDVSGVEDQPIALDLAAAVADTDGSESVESVTVSGVPTGATLSAGTDNGDGSWTLTPDQLEGLSITPPSHFSGEFELTATAVTSEADGDTASVASAFTVSVTGAADDAILAADDVSGVEDTPIALALTSSLTDTDGSESLVVTVSGVPEGASLSAGSQSGDGSWTLRGDQLDGLTITPPSNFSGGFELTATATTTESDGDTASVVSSFRVSVEGVADVGVLHVGDVSGVEDTPIALELSSSLADTDGSETLTVTISGLPSGATLSAGVDNGDGSWTLTEGQLDGLSITPPQNFSGDFELIATETSTESNGDTASVSSAFTVSVRGVADGVEIRSSDVSAFTGQASPLDFDATIIDTDGSESVTFTVRGLPEGVGLSAGTENPDGTWTLTAEQLDGVTLDTSSGYAGSFELTVTATASEADGDSASTERSIRVDVSPPVDPINDQGSEAPVEALQGEISWDEDVELGVIDTVEEIDRALDEIDGQVLELDPPARDAEVDEAEPQYRAVTEVPPLVTADADSGVPVPPPGDPIFEFVDETSSTGRVATDAEGVSPTRATAEQDDRAVTEDTAKTVRRQFAESFALLWGLIRSVGGRAPADDRQTGSDQKR